MKFFITSGLGSSVFSIIFRGSNSPPFSFAFLVNSSMGVNYSRKEFVPLGTVFLLREDPILERLSKSEFQGTKLFPFKKMAGKTWSQLFK